MFKPKPIETLYSGYKFRSRLEARWAVFFDAMGYSYEYESEGYDLGEGTKYLPDFKVSGNGLSDHDYYVEIKPRLDPYDIWKSISPQAAQKADKLATQTQTQVLVIVGDPRVVVEMQDTNNRPTPRYRHQYEIAHFSGCWRHLPLDRGGLFKLQLESHANTLAFEADTSWFDGSYQDIRRLLDLARAQVWAKQHSYHTLWGHCGVPNLAHIQNVQYERVASFLQTTFEEYSYEMDINPMLLNAFHVASQARFEHGETPKYRKVRA